MRRARTFPVHPSVLVGSDNTPRRASKGVVLLNSTPERFAAALRETFRSVAGAPSERRLVFLNAWNEWAEGNHPDPDERYGIAHLDALTAVVNGQ
jgi:hypothetical protein